MTRDALSRQAIDEPWVFNIRRFCVVHNFLYNSIRSLYGLYYIYINLIARKCYYQLRQLWVVSRSLTHLSRLTLVHAIVTSRIDCCCSLQAGLPLGTLARLDRVLRSAARLVGGLSKF